MVDDVGQGRESVVMVEATFLNLLRIEKRAQGFRAVTIMGRSLRLEIINPDFLSGVQILTRQENRSPPDGNRPQHCANLMLCDFF